jgi:hypothetical protein
MLYDMSNSVMLIYECIILISICDYDMHDVKMLLHDSQMII